MNKIEMVNYLASKYNVSHEVAEDACRANDWDLMMASGELRDAAHAESLALAIGDNFIVLVGVRQHRLTVELRLDHDGVYWAMNAGTCLKSEYSAEDIAEQARLNSLIGVKHGDVVIINGEQYRAHVNGNYSDAAIFHKV